MKRIIEIFKRKLSGQIKSVEYFEPEDGLDITTYLKNENKQGIHHLGRYHWAKDVLKPLQPQRILDIACGAGFGSFILADYLTDAMVNGADYDNRAVNASQNNYSRENLKYFHGNIVTWTREEDGISSDLGNYDAVVSFDTIEHLLHREIAFMRITENLSHNGVLLLSTPCGFENTRLNPAWEHHKMEYCYKDLQNMLKRFFKTVLIPEEDNFPNMKYWDQVINKDKQRYLNITNPVFCADPILV